MTYTVSGGALNSTQSNPASVFDRTLKTTLSHLAECYVVL